MLKRKVFQEWEKHANYFVQEILGMEECEGRLQETGIKKEYISCAVPLSTGSEKIQRQAGGALQ